MPELTRLELRAPYLVLIGDVSDPTYAKTGLGLARWAPDRVRGQWRFNADAVDLGVPDQRVQDALSEGVRSLVIGVAPAGGQLPEHWWGALQEAAEAGLDVVSGLHLRLGQRPELERAARRSGAQLIDVRVPPHPIPVASGHKRSGLRLLTVGTDCAVGKKYTALALTAALGEAGFAADFRATGQTGIMLCGSGIPIDAVVADFIAGAAEMLTPDNDPNHWDIIEGQGSLFHPAYSGVSLGLLHGSQPDALVLCHDAARERLSGWASYDLPGLRESIDRHLEMGRRVNPGVRCVGVSVNSSALPKDERRDRLAEWSRELALPCVDPLADGCGALVAELARQFGAPR